MSALTHNYLVPQAPAAWSASSDTDWQTIPALTPFVITDNSRVATYQTTTRLCYDAQALHIHFECDDPDIWATMTRRDDPIYDEEVVEVFLAPGTDDPTHYFEFEISPDGVLFDAKIVNPGQGRAKMEIITAWDCPGIQWRATRQDSAHTWSATLTIPWLAVAPPGLLPNAWRANFTRIERPRGGEPEYSCWSPTITVPANFHEPSQFGVLRFV